MSPLKKVIATKKKNSVKKSKPKNSFTAKLISWASFLTAPRTVAKTDTKHVQIRKRGLTKRQIGKKGLRKVDITIIGFVALIAILVSFSSVQDYFKASILSLGQKNAVVASAQSRIGIGYKMGGTGPDGYDCSGFTSTVMKEALGINLPRTSRDQYSVGQDIAFDDLGVGDLVFFATSGGSTISHVGIITNISGSQIKMTHANSYSGRVQEEDIKQAAYWQQTYIGAREITNATKDIVADTKPDPTFKKPAKSSLGDEYNSYFPPSESTDPRLKVGAATIETNTTSTKVISDTSVQATARPTVTASSTPTASATATPSSSATITPSSTSTATPTASVSVTPTATATSTASTTPSATVTASPTPTSTTTPTATPSNKLFSDVSTNHYAANAIEKLSKLGVINGYNDGTFRPDASVTRAELTKMVYLASKKPVKVMNTNPFSDVDTNNALSKYVLSAYRENLLKGYKDFTFRPQSSVTKAEGSKIVLKAFTVAGEKPKQTISDLGDLGDLENFIGYMINHKLLPVVDNLVRPNTPLTRAQTAYILASLIE